MAWRRHGNGAVALAQQMCNGGRLGRSQKALPLRGGFAKPRDSEYRSRPGCRCCFVEV
jgi:hypothetical protein